jgi:hypothetical protein
VTILRGQRPNVRHRGCRCMCRVRPTCGLSFLGVVGELVACQAPVRAADECRRLVDRTRPGEKAITPLKGHAPAADLDLARRQR